MNRELIKYKVIAEAMSLLLFPHAEVIIHDLPSGKIGAIFNNFSKRKVGDESLLGDMKKPTQDLFPPYPKTNYDGRKLKSVSAVIKDDKGEAIGLFCVNLDLSKWEEMHHFIVEWMKITAEKEAILFTNDWKEKINLYVSAYLKERALQLKSLTRKEKRELLLKLQSEGAFETKNAASYIANVLQISRATLYNYLK